MAGGRKSMKEEIEVVKYMTELAGPTFDFIKSCIEGKNKPDKKWAVEQMIKLYGKAIPDAGDDPTKPIYVQIAKELAEKNNIDESNPETVDNSPGSSPLPGPEHGA